jgi:hypothetical protein
MPSARFELAIQLSERPQTNVLDRAATGTGTNDSSLSLGVTTLCGFVFTAL